ncbi:MAG: SdiA-regulated domain-containing protein [Gillisia sp.]|nr:SdiA-regulated domain-containing protein [Gillisia sp.]
MKKTAFLISTGVLLLVGAIYFSFDGIAPARSMPGAQLVKIEQKWELPDILSEVSGIAMMDNNRIASIQDEDGIIFIYNLKTSKIEQKVEFGDSGDYEGIALVGTTAYVLRSDGSIFEVNEFANQTTPAIKHTIPLKGKYDFEGLCYDKKNNRLLLNIKDMDKDEFKPIFAFDLSTKQLNPEPVFNINFNDPVFDIMEVKKSGKILRPTEIGIHPLTGNIYVLEAKNPKLLILDPTGKPLKLYVFKEEQFRQAEGLSFSKEGKLYISNEGNHEPGNILKISLD